MDNNIAREWIVELRSGNYGQATGTLKGEENTYCCLGVLCEIAVRKGIISTPQYLDSFGGWFYQADGNVLPYEVQSWADMASRNGALYLENGPELFLAGMNDNGATFDELADLIEENMDDL